MLVVFCDTFFLMRHESQKPLKSPFPESSASFIVTNKRGVGTFEIDSMGHQQFVRIEPTVDSAKAESTYQPNWFGSKESIGHFTGKLYEGIRSAVRTSHWLEMRTNIERLGPEERTDPVVFSRAVADRTIVMQGEKAS